MSNLAWSVTSDELVSSHGYSQNQIVLWSLPSMTPVTTLLGHTSRVLYMASSPGLFLVLFLALVVHWPFCCIFSLGSFVSFSDGQSIVTGAGDGTLRLWKVFPPKAPTNPHRQEPLDPFVTIR